MIAAKKDLIVSELELGTGAAITADLVQDGLRQGLKIWFSDLDEKHGPITELRPYGLNGYHVCLFFGSFSGSVIRQIKNASHEDVQLSRALVSSIKPEIKVDILSQNSSDWMVKDGSFKISAKIRGLQQSDRDLELVSVCKDVIVPLMAAMAELIGYDVVDDVSVNELLGTEGTAYKAIISRRERNPRNRLLCIRIHGEKCKVCGLEPKQIYGEAGSIIEVHHLEPLALLEEARVYNPLTDLVPLCPNCHRAAHTKRPTPFTLEELMFLRDFKK